MAVTPKLPAHYSLYIGTELQGSVSAPLLVYGCSLGPLSTRRSSRNAIEGFEGRDGYIKYSYALVVGKEKQASLHQHPYFISIIIITVIISISIIVLNLLQTYSSREKFKPKELSPTSLYLSSVEAHTTRRTK